MEAWHKNLTERRNIMPVALVSAKRSRSDPVTVAVGFSPRIGTPMTRRRVATLEKLGLPFMRRYATRPFPAMHRGLKPTATVGASLRDAVVLREQCRRMGVKPA